MDHAEAAKEMEGYLQGAYKFGKWENKAKEIGINYLQDNTYDYTRLFTKIGCSFMEEALNWEDLHKRFSSFGYPFKFSEKDSKWFSKDVRKTLARKIKEFIIKNGWPENTSRLNELLTCLNISTTENKGLVFKKVVPKPKEDIIFELEVIIAG